MINPDATVIAKGFSQSRLTTKKWAKSFYFSSLFLPKDKRQAAYSIYALCRACDNSVDNPEDGSQSSQLDLIRQKISRSYNDQNIKDPLLFAFRDTVRKYAIPQKYFNELTDGMALDIQKKRYQKFDELYEYCYKVAGVVGLIMLKIFGTKDSKAEIFAVDLGVAMQLTNIIRDINEDYSLGRVYLPQDELARFNVPEEIISQKKITEKFQNLLAFQIKRAREYYKKSEQGFRLISDPRSRFVVRIMKDVYAQILNVVEQNDFDVFSERAHVPLLSKLLILLRLKN